MINLPVSFLNISSLILGLAAWTLPIIGILTRKKQKRKSLFLLTIFSFGFCAFALLFQISYNNHLVRIADWTALADTSGTVQQVSSILLWVTLFLNALQLLLGQNNKANNK